jgi:peptidoglycan/LPS O-acetylase OafA/YrhL
MCGHLYDRLFVVSGQLLFYGLAFLTISLFAVLGKAALSYIIWFWCMVASLKPENKWLLGVSRFLSYQALTYFGDRSYSFYLFHQAVLACCAATFLHYGVSSKIEMLVLLFVVALPLTFILSMASYRFIELPIIKYAKAISRRKWALICSSNLVQ